MGHRSILSLTLSSTLCSACLITQESVELYEGARSGESYLGFTPNPGETVSVQVLRTTNVRRADAAARWTTLGSAVSGTTPAATSGGIDYYAYSISAPAPALSQWPTGGVARLRVRYGTGSSGTNGNTFDDLGCIYEIPSETWLDRSQRCRSEVGSGYLHYVDGSVVTGSSQPYISLRETPKTRFMGRVVENPAEDYYARIDPRSDPAVATERETLFGFEIANGFFSSAGYGPEINARYFNRGDLELGRDMHCKRALTGESACYVTNYGDPSAFQPAPGDDPHASLAAAIQRDANGLVATVAMEFKGGTGPDAVTFYVYDDNGDRVEDVALDSEGGKTIPGACLSCHGGTFDDTTHSVTGAKYLPFDVENFTFSTTSPWRRSDQEEEIRALNELVYDAEATAPTQELIEGWYGNVGSRPDFGPLGLNQDTSFVPPGWAGEELLYREVVAPYCRGCHVGVFDGFGALTSFNEFQIYSGLISDFVCSSKIMPHAEVTRENFWRSEARGYLIGRLDLATACN